MANPESDSLNWLLGTIFSKLSYRRGDVQTSFNMCTTHHDPALQYHTHMHHGNRAIRKLSRVVPPVFSHTTFLTPLIIKYPGTPSIIDLKYEPKP